MPHEKPKGAIGKFLDSTIVGPLVRIPRSFLLFENPFKTTKNVAKDAVKDTALLLPRLAVHSGIAVLKLLGKMSLAAIKKTPFFPVWTKYDKTKKLTHATTKTHLHKLKEVFTSSRS